MIGVRVLTGSKSSMSRGTPTSRAIASRCNTRLVEPPEAALQEFHDQFAGTGADLVLAAVEGWGTGRAHRRETEELQDHRHGVRRKLAAARARSGAGVVLQVEKVFIRHSAGRVRSDALEDVLDRHVVTLEAAGGYRAGIDDGARHAESRVCHGGGRDSLVAADDRYHRVEHVAAPDELYGVGDHLPAHERGLHPLRPHGYAVRDGDGIQLHRRAAGLPDAIFDLLRQVTMVEVARHSLDPGVGNAHYGLAQVLVGEAHPFQKGPGGRTVAAFEDGAAPVPDVCGLHGYLPTRG